jgi:signal transduction histidine kinase
VRDLASAQYAALGIVGQLGQIEQFVTSGITAEERARIGPLPQGHGLLGLIIREDRSLLVDDLAVDPRRHGFPPHHPEMHSLLGVPVRSKERTIGNLYLTNKLPAGGFSVSDQRLVEMFALHAGIAMENARLHEEVQRLAVVEERERISQDLHDSIIQSLYAISLSLEDLPEVISEDPAAGAVLADRAIDSIHGTISDIRSFIMGLQPGLLEEADLGDGIQSLAEDFRRNTRIELAVHFPEAVGQLSDEVGGHVLAIVREGLSNIARHSGATRASVEVGESAGRLRLTIRDNGTGFDTSRPVEQHHRGLANLRARAEALGGHLEVISTPAEGTALTTEIPSPPDSTTEADHDQ